MGTKTAQAKVEGAEQGRAAATEALAGGLGSQVRGVTSRTLAAEIARSPRMVAQRRQIREGFGGGGRGEEGVRQAVEAIDVGRGGVQGDCMGGAVQLAEEGKRQDMTPTHGSDVVQRTQGRLVGTRWVSGEEQDRDALSNEYYPTWGFIEELNDRNGNIENYVYPKREPVPAWTVAWAAFDASFTLETQKWIAGGRTNFSAFAIGQPIWGLRDNVAAAGGLLSKGMKGPGPIPMRDHPDEVAVSAFIGRANVAHAGWLPNPTLAGRGPLDNVAMSPVQLSMLKKRPQAYLGGWTSHPSDSARWALHRAGPPGAQIDPRTGAPCTFIYHVL